MPAGSRKIRLRSCTFIQPADEIEGIGIKLALYIYMSGVDPETADSAVEQVLSAYKDCVQVLGRDLLAEVKGLMPAWQQGV